MARNKWERVHHVKCSMQVLELTKAGSSMHFTIDAEGVKLGEISLGRGSFIWKGKHDRKGGTRYRWIDFADIMDRIASGDISVRRKRS